MPRRAVMLALSTAFSIAWANAGLCDGQFDPTWAGGGRISFAADTFNPGHGSEAHRITLQRDGRLLVGGIVFGSGAGPYWWIGEFDQDGFPVPGFGQGDGSGLVTGCWLSPELCGGYFGGGRALQDDGRIAVVSGTTVARTTPGANALDAAGVVGGTGIASLELELNDAGGRMTTASAIAALPSGKWIVAGEGRYDALATRTDIAIMRLNPDFSLDPAYNVTTDANGTGFAGGRIVALPATFGAFAFNIVVQDDGGILLHANASPDDGGASFGVMLRLDPDGAPDPGFGVDGIATLPQCGFFANTIHVDRAGRTLASCAGPGTKLIRVLPDGTPDPSFGNAGIASISPPELECSGGTLVFRPTTDSAGRILVPGYCISLIDADGDGVIDPDRFIVARLHGDDGSLDSAFGDGGFVFGQFADDSVADGAYAVVIDGSGRPLVNGFSTPGLSMRREVGIARLAYDLVFHDGFEAAPRGRLVR